MPLVLMRLRSRAHGYETRDELDADTELKARIESIG